MCLCVTAGNYMYGKPVVSCELLFAECRMPNGKWDLLILISNIMELILIINIMGLSRGIAICKVLNVEC